MNLEELVLPRLGVVRVGESVCFQQLWSRMASRSPRAVVHCAKRKKPCERLGLRAMRGCPGPFPRAMGLRAGLMLGGLSSL